MPLSPKGGDKGRLDADVRSEIARSSRLKDDGDPHLLFEPATRVQ